nr:Mll4041 protein [uncultured bacterium]
MCMQRTQYGISRCPHYDYCDYVHQYQECNIRIYTHAHLLLERTMLDEDLPAIVIIDEDFTNNLVEHIEVPFSLLSHVEAIPEFRDAIRAIMNWAITKDHVVLIQEFQKQGGAWSELADKLKKLRPTITPGDSDQIVHNSLSKHQNVRPVATLLSHLDRVLSRGLMPTAIDIDPSKLTVHHRHEITRFGNLAQGNGSVRFYITDATISETIIRQCLPVDSVEVVAAQRNAIVMQCSDSICSTSSLDPTRHTDPQMQGRATTRLADVQALLDELASTGLKILAVGPSAITGNPAKNAAPKLTTAPNVHLAHFGAIRGIDTWKNCDVLVLIGRNEPTAQSVEDIARALFYDDPNPLKLTGKWQSRTAGFDMVSGEQLGVEIWGHEDPRVHEVLVQVREAESIQALDRLRLIHNIDPKLVIVLSKLPLPGVKVDRLLPWAELTRGGEFELLYRNSGGVLPLNASWIAQKTGKTTSAAKKAVQRMLMKGHSPLRFSQWKMSPLKQPQLAWYRPVGQRNWSRFFHDYPTTEDAKTPLEALLGVAVKVKP